MYKITASIVTYRNNIEILKKAIASFLDTGLETKLIIVDNSESDEIGSICSDKRVEYIFNNRNIGFAAGHNIAIRKLMGLSQYHLVLNPDVFFEPGTLERCYSFMEENKDVGMAMPKIRFFDGSIQRLCKLLPTPLELILRRMDSPVIGALFRKRLDRYCLAFTGYDKIMDVPHISGCFMFIRQEVFAKTGLFDERFFMYMEDMDFSRRVRKNFRTVYYPPAVGYHQWGKHSYSNLTALKYHAISAMKYFNKWGWFFDKERKQVNDMILEKYFRNHANGH